MGGDIALVPGRCVSIRGFPPFRYMGDGSVVRLVVQIDKAELNPVPPKV